MLDQDIIIMMGIGGGFVVLGVLAILWGWYEEKSYMKYLASRRDLREFMVQWPVRPQAASLKIGGWIAIALGAVLLGVGLVKVIMGQSF
jgi:hypothetical protein